MCLFRIEYALLATILVSCLKKNACETFTSNSVNFTYGSDGVLKCYDSASYYITDSSARFMSAITVDNVKYQLNGDTLTIKSLKKSDVDAFFYCNATNRVPIFFKPNVAPYLYQVDYQMVSCREQQALIMSCYLLVGSTGDGQSFTWTWSFTSNSRNNASQLTNGDRYTISTSSSSSPASSTLVVSPAYRSDTGNYYCQAANSYGTHKRVTLGRVKDQYISLWLALGLLAEIAILVLIIVGNSFASKSLQVTKTKST